jgi:hypothetical protein
MTSTRGVSSGRSTPARSRSPNVDELVSTVAVVGRVESVAERPGLFLAVDGVGVVVEGAGLAVDGVVRAGPGVALDAAPVEGVGPGVVEPVAEVVEPLARVRSGQFELAAGHLASATTTSFTDI